MSGVLNMMIGSGLGPFSAVTNRDALSGFRSGKGSVQTSLSVTAAPVNGVPAFTYSWTKVSGDIDVICYTPTAATTYFGAFVDNPGDTFIAVWKCTITDALAATADSTYVTITLTRTS